MMQNNEVEASIFTIHQGATTEQRLLYRHCLVWFDNYLECQLLEDSGCLLDTLGPILGKDERVNARSVRKLIYWISRLASTLGTSSFLGRIAQELQQSHGLASGDDANLTSCCQSIFVVCGWITLLYKSQLPQTPRAISMHRSSMNIVSTRFRNQPVYPNSVVVDEELKALSFPQLLACFGLRAPRQYSLSATADSRLSINTRASITASNVFFSNLILVGKVKLEWVDSSVQHLDFDERTRVLKLFRHPAYCALISLSTPESTDFLNCQEKDTDSGLSHDPDDLAADRPFDNFCREILITFGIIFGQDRKSRGMARSCLRQTWPKDVASDRILQSMCGKGSKGWQHHPLFDYLASPPLRANYSVDVSFPILGPKLLHINGFMDSQSPNDFRTLFYDRRDHLRYWSFICLLGFGIASIGLGVLQVLLAIAQVVLAVRG